jgi:hypothetical protein
MSRPFPLLAFLLLTLTGAARADLVKTLERGGDLFVMGSCRGSQGKVACAPFRMTIRAGTPPTVTTRPIAVPPFTPGTGLMLGLQGSAVDVANRKVYWHAACDRSYYVTTLAGAPGEERTERFELDLGAMGIEDNGRGFCLAQMAYDARRGVVIALAGRSTSEGKSTVDFAVSLDAQGGARLLHDLRPVVDPRWLFLHNMQTIAVLNPDTDELIAPLFMTNPIQESRIAYHVGTGKVRLIGPGGGRQQSFFDLSTRQNTYFNCDLNDGKPFVPGWTSFPGPGPARITIPAKDLEAIRIGGPFKAEVCHNGFVGGGYDPAADQDFILFRQGAMTKPDDRFVLGLADLKANRWRGFIPTDATYGQFRGGNVGLDIFFMTTEFIPQP